MLAMLWHLLRLQMDDTLATTTPNTQTSITEYYSNTTTQQICLNTRLGSATLYSLRPAGLVLRGAKYFRRCLWNECHCSNVWCWLKIAAGRGWAGVNRPVIKQFLSLYEGLTSGPENYHGRKGWQQFLRQLWKCLQLTFRVKVFMYFWFQMAAFLIWRWPELDLAGVPYDVTQQ